ncbi:MAG: glycosyltransferase family 2 protein [Acidimicrobiia bacterium]|nr:glycosyltransferase family 2 protein [Acidimicrobiia bacterium]
MPAEPAAPAAPPAVVAVVVTKDPGPWFEATLAGLRDQDYPNLAVLVLDAGSAEDPTARIAAVHPRAFVRRLDGDPGFAAAANEALTAVEGAAFLLLCHDDVVPDPSCIRLLVEEAYRSNAAVVGPKLVAYDDPEVLLEVGLTIDRFGIPYSDIEPGELDQEQHDAVRDVFHVSSAVMLVRADLFRALDGFDPVTFPGGEDLDLCWRARLLGGRVMVVPDARARHLEAADEREHAGHAALGVRNRLRVVLKAYSAPTLTWVAPVAFLLGLLEAAVFAVTRRGRRARAVLAAWAWNLGHLPDLRRSRRAVQAGRTVHDRDLSFLQVRGSARIRAFVTRRLHADDRLQTITTAGRDVVEAATTRLRRPLVLGEPPSWPSCSSARGRSSPVTCRGSAP